jgi:hypothetical protein
VGASGLGGREMACTSASAATGSARGRMPCVLALDQMSRRRPTRQCGGGERPAAMGAGVARAGWKIRHGRRFARDVRNRRRRCVEAIATATVSPMLLAVSEVLGH